MITLGRLVDLLGSGAHVVVDNGIETASAAGIEIFDVTHDSRQATAGSLFACVRGEIHDGHDLAADAVSNGAVALLCERRVDVPVPQIIVSEVRSSMAVAASHLWGEPSRQLNVIGVTGTNGKTTVVSMLKSILAAAGIPTAVIGTLTGRRTTPESTDLQRQLAAFLSEGYEAVAIEVSSHALVQHRVDAVEFDLALFTNLGRDHLDFHKTQESYFAAKAKLFMPELSKRGVVNVDDVHGRLLYDARTIPMVAVSLADATDIQVSGAKTTFCWSDRNIELRMLGTHNVANAVLAATAAVDMGVGLDAVGAGLAGLPQVAGRFELVKAANGRGPDLSGARAIVDYAHTPDALQSVLVGARQVAGSQGRVLVVFGCGGDRDTEKRPQMGAVAAELADVVVVTSDNPRSEDPNAIIAAIIAGADDWLGENVSADPVASRTALVVEADRRSAIRYALHEAGDNDVVVVAGKGHETGQTTGGVTVHFDDREVVAEILAEGFKS